jgi:hypothetical protein
MDRQGVETSLIKARSSTSRFARDSLRWRKTDLNPRSPVRRMHTNSEIATAEAADARRAHIAIRTYLSTGIRLAFSPGVRDESKLAMGGEEFIETMPPDLRAGARPFAFFDKEGLGASGRSPTK